MHFRLFLALLVSLLLASCHRAATPPADTAAIQKDLENIQGTWQIVTAQQGGKDVTKECQARIPTVTFANNAWVQDMDGHPLYIAENSHFMLNPATTPKEMDHILRKVDNGKMLTLVYPCIYELDGDSLKLCWDVSLKQRPTKFATEPGNQFFFITFKRAEPKPEAQPETKPAADSQAKPAAEPETKPATQSETKPAAESESKPAAK